MAVLPFYYCYGASLLHSHLAAGGCAVLANSFMFPEKVLDEMAKLACTRLRGRAVDLPDPAPEDALQGAEFPALRWLQQAGGMLPKPFLRELRESFPEVALYVMYGQTEATSRMSYLPPEHLDEKLGSIGKGLPSTRLEVLRPDGTPVAPGSDEIGEIVASGANVTAGYWRDPRRPRASSAPAASTPATSRASTRTASSTWSSARATS